MPLILSVTSNLFFKGEGHVAVEYSTGLLYSIDAHVLRKTNVWMQMQRLIYKAASFGTISNQNSGQAGEGGGQPIPVNNKHQED